MKKNILNYYALTNDGKYVIDITAGKTEDLYNSFDKHTPYAKKDLDENLVNYIIDCARDLDKSDFIVRFRIITPPGETLMERIKHSVHNYFIYLVETEQRDLMRNLRTSLIFLVVGIAIMSLSVWVNGKITQETAVITRVFAQGLTVAAWVSLWEALATFLVSWAPYTRRIKMYKRIAQAPILFSDE